MFSIMMMIVKPARLMRTGLLKELIAFSKGDPLEVAASIIQLGLVVVSKIEDIPTSFFCRVQVPLFAGICRPQLVEGQTKLK